MCMSEMSGSQQRSQHFSVHKSHVEGFSLLGRPQRQKCRQIKLAQIGKKRGKETVEQRGP